MFQIPLRAILIAVLIHALWGANPVAGKFGLEVFPPFWSAAFRFMLGVATILIWCAIRRKGVWPASHEWKPLLWIGFLFTIQIGLMNLGFDNTSGVNSSILISVNPLFAALFAHLMLGNDRLTGLRVFGLLVAFVGVALTLWFSKAGSGQLSFGNLGDWLCLASAALLGYRLIASAQVLRTIDPIRLAIWQMLISLPMFILAGLLFETLPVEGVTQSAVIGLAYQGIIVSGVGFVVSFWLVSHYQPSVVSSFGLIAPVTGVFLAGQLLGDEITWQIVASAGLVICGMVAIAVRGRSERTYQSDGGVQKKT